MADTMELFFKRLAFALPFLGKVSAFALFSAAAARSAPAHDLCIAAGGVQGS
jgi:hypothetical protein